MLRGSDRKVVGSYVNDSYVLALFSDLRRLGSLDLVIGKERLG